MPCTQTGSIEGDRILGLTESIKIVNDKNTELTRLLCLACRRIEISGMRFPNGLGKWWKSHLKVDKKKRK